MAEAMQWVSRITTVAVMVVLPIISGVWLDGKLSTRYWSLVGLTAGLALGLWQMLLLVRSAGAKGSTSTGFGKSGRSSATTKSPDVGVRSNSAADATVEIAKQIDAALGKKSEFEKRPESPDGEP